MRTRIFDAIGIGLNYEAQISMAEIHVLVEPSYRLLALRRNLSQILRRMSEGNQE